VRLIEIFDEYIGLRERIDVLNERRLEALDQLHIFHQHRNPLMSNATDEDDKGPTYPEAVQAKLDRINAELSSAHSRIAELREEVRTF